VAEIKAEIASSSGAREGAGVIEQGLAWRENLRLARLQPEPVLTVEPDYEAYEAPEDLVKGLLSDELERLTLAGKSTQAKAIYGIAMGQAVPLRSFVDQWLREGGRSGSFKERTKKDHQRAVEGLCEWLGNESLPETAQAVDRAVAGRYVSVLLASGKAGKTISKIISSLSSYWDWLRRRGHVSEEARCPWARQAPPKARNDDQELERAFTTEEVRRLLNNKNDVTLREFMLVGALSGMRREEIGQLRVEDCQGGVFNVRRGKTKAARRRVPVHSVLTDFVQRRSEGKDLRAFLEIHGWAFLRSMRLPMAIWIMASETSTRCS